MRYKIITRKLATKWATALQTDFTYDAFVMASQVY